MNSMKKKCLLTGLLAAVMLFTSGIALADTCIVNASKLYLREKATSDSDALQSFRKGAELEILGKSGSWYKVTDGKVTGYVYAEYVSVVKSSDDSLQKGDQGNAVKQVQERLKYLGYYKNTVDGNYGNVTVTAVKAFQKKNGLTEDGVVSATTLKKLNSTSAIAANGKKASELDKESSASNDGVLKSGSKGPEVKALQERLKELGYYKSTCDGSYGSVTISAVKAFQKKNGLTQDGVAGATTLKKLNSSSAVGANDKTSSDKEETKDDGTLKAGSSGTEVKALQERLKELGYYKYTCDSSYGTRTVEAVKAFQKKNGLTADGVAGPATLKKLNSSSAVGANDKTSSDKEETKDDGTLKSGSKGTAVKELQERLKELGYYSYGCDGDFGERTVTAVKAFQKKNGLIADGIVGATTLKKLNSDSAVNAQGKTTVELKTSQTLQSGDSGAQVKALQTRLKELGYYTTSVDSDYGYRTSQAVSDFQRANGLTVNGTANSTTLKKLVSSSAISKSAADKKEEGSSSSTIKTERLDWFKNGKSVFAGRPTIQIKDVRTGLVFKAKVLYGTNHLDVEPLTKADTAILLKINGGVAFSWHRRPMLVKHDGHVYAASIYSVPHGQQTILDNNFKGQFCLHFYGSKTHGTGEVKADHQACVELAMKATW